MIQLELGEFPPSGLFVLEKSDFAVRESAGGKPG
jgi:hypothetical protein